MKPLHALTALRPAHEARAAVAWAFALAHCLALAVALRLRWPAALALCALCAAMLLLRLHEACAVWRFKLSMSAHRPQQLPSGQLELQHAALGGALWLGWGYRWQAEHTQLCHDVLKRPVRELQAPAWFRRLGGHAPPVGEGKGLGWVHGLATERDVLVPFAALEGHTAVLAITGALKTVLARLLVYQLARRGDTVIVLDPKGDRGLESVCRDVCTRLGEPGRFLKFHPAFASQSFRYDAIANWERETQVASRLQLLMGAQSDDHFGAFVWMSVTDIVRAMKRAGRRPTLSSLLHILRSPETAEALAEELLQPFLAGEGIDAAGEPPRGGPAAGPAGRKEPADGRHRGAFSSPRLARWVRQFREQVPAGRRPADIAGLIAVLETNREWFAKMVVGLTPILTRLTASDLGALLSPDHTDIHDPRPVYTARKLIDGRHVVYFGLDALSDTAVAESLAALVLADLAGTAGESYNRAQPADGPPPRVHVVCDEWGDLVCEPIIQLANKGRGVGIVLYLFGQTLSDLEVKLGDAGRAKRVLGNMNNFIVGATSDTDTLDFMARKFGDTVVQRATLSQSAGQKTEDTGLEFAATRQTSITEQAHELVPAQVLMGLPDLQYFAIVNRAQVFKGRIPVLTFDAPTGVGACSGAAPPDRMHPGPSGLDVSRTSRSARHG